MQPYPAAMAPPTGPSHMTFAPPPRTVDLDDLFGLPPPPPPTNPAVGHEGVLPPADMSMPQTTQHFAQEPPFQSAHQADQGTMQQQQQQQNVQSYHGSPDLGLELQQQHHAQSMGPPQQQQQQSANQQGFTPPHQQGYQQAPSNHPSTAPPPSPPQQQQQPSYQAVTQHNLGQAPPQQPGHHVDVAHPPQQHSTQPVGPNYPPPQQQQQAYQGGNPNLGQLPPQQQVFQPGIGTDRVYAPQQQQQYAQPAGSNGAYGGAAMLPSAPPGMYPHGGYAHVQPYTSPPASHVPAAHIPPTGVLHAPSPPPPPPGPTVEDEDKAQLEKIIRLRQELEMEQQREQQKRDELKTWGCAECTYRNPLAVLVCEMCGNRKPGAPPVGSAPVAATATTVSTPATQVVAPAPVSHSGPWTCSICTAQNVATQTRCSLCSAYRDSTNPPPPTSAVSAKPTPAVTSSWRCSICGQVNGPSQPNCVVCNSYQANGVPVETPAGKGTPAAATPPTPSTAPSNWTCSVCTLENPVARGVCAACHSGQRPRHLDPRGGERQKHKDKGMNLIAAVAAAAVATEWACPACSFINTIRRKKCDMCSGERPPKFDQAARSAEAKSHVLRPRDDAPGSDDEEVQWQEDHAAKECNRCHMEFGLMRRRHHCRACGYVFCATCSPFHIPLKKNGQSERVCVSCYEARGKDGRGK